MGDRNNPIKFGPEWLRNMSRERSAVRSSPTSQSANSGPGAVAGPPGASGGASAAGASGSSGGATAGTSASTANSTNYPGAPSKILLAKLRYGREEMLALYDRNSEAPPELKSIDTLYQPRGKQPFALNNTFEDDMRDSMRNAPPIGGMTPGDRYGLGRGSGRGGTSDGRGKSRGYSRSLSTGRGTTWHTGSPRMPGYSGSADDDGGPMRSWNSNSNRNSGEQSESWPNKMFRSKRQGQTNTNWRQQQTRDDGEEWRSSEPGRSRQNDKWERDWGDRPSGDKPQSWNTNRRTWGGGETHSNEENLPEWAGENAECGGTFDSSGAFHGYSNDDTSLPKHQDSSYPLTRSHTHSTFSRSKTVEEGSDEWWASEKAKKLSPKRFDASDIKFKKQPPTMGIAELGNSAAASKEYAHKTNKDEPLKEIPEKKEKTATAPEPPEANNTKKNDEKFAGKNVYKTKYSESKTFDAMMRSNINMDEANDERGNFQSVIITPNNSLRQKHQHIVPASETVHKIPPSKIQNAKSPSSKNVKHDKEHSAHKSPEELLVDNVFGMAIDEKENIPTQSPNSLLTLSSSGMPTGLGSPANSMPQMQNPNMQINMPNSVMQNQLSMDGNVNKQNMQTSGIPQPGFQQMQPSGIQHTNMQVASMQQSMQQVGHQTSGMQSGGHTSVGMQAGMQPQGMPVSGMQAPGKQMHTSGLAQLGLQSAGMQSGVMQNSGLSQVGLASPGMQSGMQNSGMPSSIQNSGLTSGTMQSPGMPSGLQNQGLSATGLQSARFQTPGMQPGGITNSALNASLGLPIVPSGNMGIPLPNVQHTVYPNVCMANNIGASMGASGIQNTMGSASLQGNMPGFQTGSGIPGMSNANVGNNSLFLGQNSNNPSMSSSSDIPMPNHAGQNMFPMHGLQHSGSQGAFGNSIYSNNLMNAADQWYYEDPKRNIQGPFSSKDMFNWYRAGFFTSSLMVRRACETIMRPLGSYGPGVPFAQMDMMPQYPMYDARPQAGHDTMMNSQAGLGLDVDLLWGQSTNDLMWMHKTRNEARVNNLPMYFWDQQPSAIASNSLLPEEITKEMKTEDQILAQMRASQNISQPPTLPFMDPSAANAANTKSDDRFAAAINATPNLEELHRLMQQETLTGNLAPAEPEHIELQVKAEKTAKLEQTVPEANVAKTQTAPKGVAEPKPAKQKTEADKAVKNKENNNTKNKGKKSKEEKKDEVAEVKAKEDEAKADKRSQERSPSKSKKEEKSNKKELEREKKEWIKEGFTIVKGPEKTTAKDGKKKVEEARAAEEVERKRKEDEKLAIEEEKKKKHSESQKKQQEPQQQQQQRQASESVVKKAPWSAIANLTLQSVQRDGPTLAEIQRLEREKKLEQMKEQQQMMQIIAQQQAAALAREQEMQAGLGWAKKKGNNLNTSGQSLAEIQAEARKQAVAAAAAAQAQAFEEAQQAAPAPPANHVPWANNQNGGGFWDTQPNQPSKPEKPQEPPKPAEPTKNKKKLTLTTPAKKETSPAAEFETWCTTFLSPWSAKIDVPTFVGFLKDIESPYEVKDYVKCYLGDSKDSNDFARQFLERRSKLLRVGMVTPSDDLCSPAIAVNPRTVSGSDYQEVKGKGKKSKKNKMLKVDARILGFSVTASEDRINVGDIDTV